MSAIQQLLASYKTPTLSIPNLVAHYAGENNLNDSSGNGNTATSSSPSYTTGYVGNCFNIGSDSNAIVTPNLSLGSEWTIEVLINTSVNSSRIIWSFGDDVGLYVNSSRQFFYFGPIFLGTSGLQADNLWSKIKTTYDGEKIRIYFDDVLVATESGTHSETRNGAISFGWISGQNHFAGKLDEIKVYNAVV